jgi:hypothetical protein
VNRTLSLLVLAALLAAGCVLYRYEAESPETTTWPAAGLDNLNFDIDNGAVTVTAADDTVITALVTKSCRGTSQSDAEAHLADIVTGDSTTGTTLFLWGNAPQPNSRSYNTKYEVTAPAATGLYVNTENGAVELNGMDSTSGSATVIAANGAVRVAGHRGSLNVQAANGAIDCDVAGLWRLQAVVLHSANGRVTLALPADVSVGFELVTSNGSAVIESFTNVEYTQNDARHKRGYIGTQGTDVATVLVRSENGNVTLKRR